MRPLSGLLALGVAQPRLNVGHPIQRVPFALFGGQAEPGVGFDPVLGHARARQVQHRQAGLGRGETLERGLPQPVNRTPEIQMRRQGVITTQLELRGGVPLGRCFPDPVQGGAFVGVDAPAGHVAQPQIQLGGRVGKRPFPAVWTD